MARRYGFYWHKLKYEKRLEVYVNQTGFFTFKRMIFKEKDEDLGWKLTCAEEGKYYRIGVDAKAAPDRPGKLHVVFTLYLALKSVHCL